MLLLKHLEEKSECCVFISCVCVCVCMCVCVCVCVMQAQTGETDVSAEPTVKTGINAAEHVHSTPQPEKVRCIHKHVGPKKVICSFIID